MSSDQSLMASALLQAASGFLSGGTMGSTMRAFDWNVTPLGDPAKWPQPLKTLVGVMLAADQPMFVAWGAERTLLYNDAYAPMLADRHPEALGRPFMEVWSEAEAELTPLVEQVFAGTPVHMDDIELFLDRPGRPREAHFAFSYTPVHDEDGNVRGLFCPCTETTSQVLAERRREADARRQRTLLQQMPGFVAVLTGPTHVFDYVNDAYVAISGNRPFLGRSVREVFPELEGQGFYELLNQVYATGEQFTAQALPVHLAGERRSRFIDLLYQPIRDDDGQVTGIFVGGYDITERVRVEQRRDVLLRLEERLRDLADTAELSFVASELLGETLDAARVGYGTVDPDARTITVERNWSAPGFASVAGIHAFQDYGSYIDDLSRGQVVANADVRFDSRTASNVASFDALGISAFLDVPVVEQGRLTSEIFVHSEAPRAWTDEEIDLVREVATRTRAAIAPAAKSGVPKAVGSPGPAASFCQDGSVPFHGAMLATQPGNDSSVRISAYLWRLAAGRSECLFDCPQVRRRRAQRRQLDAAPARRKFRSRSLALAVPNRARASRHKRGLTRSHLRLD